MAVRLGPGNAFVYEPGVQLIVAREPQPRHEEAFTHEPDLVLVPRPSANRTQTSLRGLRKLDCGVQATGSTR
jgi:hypothetical protein